MTAEHDRRLLYGKHWRWNPRNWSYQRRVILPASLRACARLRVMRTRQRQSLHRMDELVERLLALGDLAEGLVE